MGTSPQERQHLLASAARDSFGLDWAQGGRPKGPGVTAAMTEGGRGAQQPLEATTLLPALRIQAAHTHTHTTTTSSSAAGRRREGGGRPQTQSGSRTARIINPTMRKRVVGRAAWWMLLLRMLAWGAEGSSGRLQDWVGQDAGREPAIDSPNASRAEKASKSQESRRRAASFLRHEARQSTPSLPTWFPSVRVWEKAGVGFDWPLGCLRLYPAKRFNGSDGSWLISRRWTCPGSPHLGAIPVRRETCLMDGIKSNKDAVISPLQAQHDATRGAHARSPLPASIKCRSPTWRVAQRRPPTTTQAKTTTDTE